MDRDLAPAAIAELDQPSLTGAHLVTIYLDSQVLRLTTYDRPITWGEYQWLATGGILAVGDVQESVELNERQLPITLSAINQVFIALLLSEPYLNRRVMVHHVLLNDSGDPIAEPGLIFRGVIDEPVLVEDPTNGTSTLTIQVVKNTSAVGRHPGRHTNDAEQQAYFPGDRGFKFVSSISRYVVWGGKES